MVNSLNELKKNFMREYANMTSTKDALEFVSFIGTTINQLRE